MYHLGEEALMMFGTFATQMFQLPSVVTNTIAATRIYRSLADYTLDSSNMYPTPFVSFFSRAYCCRWPFCSSSGASFSKSDTVSRMKWNKTRSISHRIEVTVDTTSEHYPTSRTTLGVGTQQGDKPYELSVASDLERAIETGIAK